MAVTQRKPEEQYKPSAEVQYAQQQVQQAQQQKPQAYQQSQQVQQAQQQMQQNQAAKPQGYNSKYSGALDSILQQIQNPQQFKYDFNGDELFKYYADLYTQKGKQASMDAMGQAAALTGGYGNSYAQQAGNQAYDQYLLSLYDKGMDLRDRAYQQHQDQLANQRENYNMLANADEREYGRYRDEYGNWQDERDYLAGRYDTERNLDYNQYRDQYGDWQDERNYAADRYDTERNTDYTRYADERDFAEKQYQSDLEEAYRRDTFDWNKDTDQRDYDRGVLESDRSYEEQVRQANLDEAYRRDTFDWNKYTDQRDYDRGVLESNRAFDEQVRQADLDEAYRRDQLNEDIRQFNVTMDEKVRQFDAELDWDKMSEEQKYAAQYAEQILANGQMPSQELLEAAGLSAEDAAKMMAKLSSGGSPKKQDDGNTEYGSYYVEGAEGVFYESDENGNLKKDENGKFIKVNKKNLPNNAGIVENPSWKVEKMN